MKVELVRHTSDALELLLETKNTRLTSTDNICNWSEEKKSEHLEYMRNTIKSSWEFVDYVFKIEVVTRVFTHQLVRTRTGSYAQQAMRVADVRNQEIITPQSILDNPDLQAIWSKAMESVKTAYGDLVDAGCPMQDARAVLPQNISTNIFAKYNLRTLSDMAKLRLCTRTQSEYQDVFRAMREQVLNVHPWVEEFLQVHCVADGSCAFPSYGKKDCPVYFPELDRTEAKKTAKEKFWSIRYEANPVAKNGKAM